MKKWKNFFENYFDLACIWLQMLMIGMGFLGLLSYWNSIPGLKLMFKAQVYSHDKHCKKMKFVAKPEL